MSPVRQCDPRHHFVRSCGPAEIADRDDAGPLSIARSARYGFTGAVDELPPRKTKSALAGVSPSNIPHSPSKTPVYAFRHPRLAALYAIGLRINRLRCVDLW